MSRYNSFIDVSYSGKETIMKTRTKETANLLRILASFLLFVGMVSSIALIVLGTMSTISGNKRITLGITGILFIVYGLILAFHQLLTYAILCGFSVLIENSDRSVTEHALFEISDRLRDLNVNSFSGQQRFQNDQPEQMD